MSVNEWKEALTDYAVNLWCLSEANADDPHQMLMDIMRTELQWFEDPTISKTAAEAKRARAMHDLITQIAEGRAGNPVNAAQRFLEGLEAGS